jgi:hypothetical protein
MARKQVHVVYKGSVWQVEVQGEASARSTHYTKEPAVAAGRILAKSLAPSELYIHLMDGTIGERETYGDDPYPPRG